MKNTVLLLAAAALISTGSAATLLYSNAVENNGDFVLVSGTDPFPTGPDTFTFQGAAGLGETPTAGNQGAVYWGQHSGMVHNLDFSLSGIAGQEVSFTMDTLWKNDNNAAYRNAIFEVFSVVGAVETSLGTLTGTLPTQDPSSAAGDGTWSTYSLNNTGLVDGDYRLRVTVETTGNNGAFDNFQVTAIPEPTSTALLGLGGLALLARRRR